MPPFEIIFTPLADGELAAIRVFDRRRVIADIEDQLSHQTTEDVLHATDHP